MLNSLILSEKYSVIFQSLLEERLHPLTLAFMVSLVTHCDVLWKRFFPPLSPSSEGRVWPRCVRSLPPQAIWLHHRLELDGGRAGNIISRQRLRERLQGREPREVISVFMSVHVDLSATSEAIRANSLSLLLPILYVSLILSPSLLLRLSPAEMENLCIAEQWAWHCHV